MDDARVLGYLSLHEGHADEDDATLLQVVAHAESGTTMVGYLTPVELQDLALQWLAIANANMG